MEEHSKAINDRIRYVLDIVFGGNVTAMARATGIKRTTLSSVIGNGHSTPSADIISRIADISSPYISMEWLIRGEGDMPISDTDSVKYNTGINGDNNKNNSVNDSGTLHRLLTLLESKDKQIEEKDKQISTLLNIVQDTKK